MDLSVDTRSSSTRSSCVAKYAMPTLKMRSGISSSTWIYLATRIRFHKSLLRLSLLTLFYVKFNVLANIGFISHLGI